MTASRIAVLLLLVLVAVPARAAGLGDFEGVFVGVSETFDGDGHSLDKRDVDMVITGMGGGGFSIELTSVALVDGRRDVPGVRRRAFVGEFVPSENGKYFVAKAPFEPFEERKSTEMIAGAPLEWAEIEGNSLIIYTFAVLDDGRFELQVYERALDGDIMRTLYERHLDGTLERQTIGQMVRSD
ncbi:MAG: hypothetical protein KDJ77_06125 [Rhodobiaceae bacterium]|nr:hypothetical protein [Rhodobiaceae bacterium]